MPKDTIKVIAGALGLALYTTALVSPPRPAVADGLTEKDKEYLEARFTAVIGAMAREMGARLTANNEPLANAIRDANQPLVDAIRDMTAQQPRSVRENCGDRPDCRPVPVNCGEDCRPHHHHEPTKVVVVEKVVHVAPHRPHWCCRPPPPPVWCPPGWGPYY